MSEVKHEIYPNKIRAYESERLRLAESNISPANKQLIAQFLNFRVAAGTKQVRITKLSLILRQMADWWLKLDYDKATKNDIEQLLAQINLCEKYKQNTKADYRRLIRQFYLSWYQYEDKRLKNDNKEIREEAEQLYKYVERHVKRNDQLPEIDFRNILTDEDIDVVIENGCRTTKEKAFIRTLHETGARVGEFLNIQIRDVEIRPNFARIRLDGKTGERRVTIAKFAKLSQWLEEHPLKHEPNANLWVGESERYGHTPLLPLLHRGGQKLIHKCFRRAGYIKVDLKKWVDEHGKKHIETVKTTFRKRCNYHQFRHSRASLLAPKMAEGALCKYMGWELGSGQVRRYVHLSPEQTENAYLKAMGISDEKETIQKPLQLKCDCGTVNDNTSRYCRTCGKPLTVAIAINDQDLIKTEMDKSIQLLMTIAKNPELMRQFEEFKKNINN